VHQEPGDEPMLLCPFCMKYHQYSVIECPEKRVRIPFVYIEDAKRGVPIVVMLTIGYSGHGKTCYLSSLFHTLYRGSLPDIWPGFSFIGLTMETLNKMHNEYVNILDHGRLPPKTPIMFPSPLIVKFQQIPLKVKSFFKKYVKGIKIEQSDVICIFYDIGGGTFEVDAKITQNIPVLVEVNTLVFLVSMPRILDSAQSHMSAVQQLHKLLNTIVLAIGKIGAQKKKDLLVCFTMGDEMWDCIDNRYGQLSLPIHHQIPTEDRIFDYFAECQNDSELLCQHIQETYTPFYNAIGNNFRSVRFTTISALGNQPTDTGEITHLSPTNIFDPFLALLQSEGHL
jgi:hypothetical protein